MRDSNRRRKFGPAGRALFLATAIWHCHAAWGADTQPAFTPSVNDFGATGLLQMPNARFHDDGEVNVGASYVDPYGRYFLTLQGLPWLEGTFRYTDIRNRLFSDAPEFSGDQSAKDRGVDVKVRLLEETSRLPQLAVGLRDIGGTTLFGSEFLVASRRHYNWDFTLGLAWGNAGSRGHLPNPLGLLNDRFKTRTGSSGPGGQLTGDLFRGDRVALFGGVEYLTPIDGLRLKLEYDGNDYQSEPLGNRFDTGLPINFAAEYDLFPWFRVSAGLERGNRFLVRGNLHVNLNSDKEVPKIDRPAPPVTPRGNETEDENPVVELNASAFAALRVGIADGDASDPKTWAIAVDRLFDRLEGRGLEVSDIAFEGRSAILWVPVEGPRPSDDSLAKAALDVRRMGLTGPIDIVTFVATKDGVNLSRTGFNTADLVRSMGLTGSAVALVEPPDSEWRAAFGKNEPALPGEVGTAVRTADEHSIDRVATEVFAELEQQAIQGERLDLDGPRATLYFAQGKYRNPAKAIGRAARVVARHAPPEVEEISLVLSDFGIPVSRVTMLRTDLERAVMDAGSPEEIWHKAIIEAGAPPGPGTGIVNRARYPQYSWSILPKLRQHIGGPDNFYFYQLWVQTAAGVELAPGLSVTGSAGVNLYNNFDSLELESDSVLPHVRSDIKDYLKEGTQWVEALHADYMTTLAPAWYGRVSAGIFELMFAGVGGEVLYRPVGKRWAAGLDVNYVRQRDFDGRFGFRDYDVVTGHLSYYHRLPFYEILATVRVGRYLAKDRGATLELSRTFDSGVTFGVFATKTDVSAEEFGEGSFDKGFFVSIPLDLFFASPTRQQAGFLFRPLTRDGGQRLEIPKPLYEVTSGADARAIGQGWAELLQ